MTHKDPLWHTSHVPTSLPCEHVFSDRRINPCMCYLDVHLTTLRHCWPMQWSVLLAPCCMSAVYALTLLPHGDLVPFLGSAQSTLCGLASTTCRPFRTFSTLPSDELCISQYLSQVLLATRPSTIPPSACISSSVSLSASQEGALGKTRVDSQRRPVQRPPAAAEAW